MKKGTRITLTKTQAESKEGQFLLSLMLDICHDGELTIDEIEQLHIFLRRTTGEFAAIPFLRSITRQIVADGAVDASESYTLKKAFLRVAPKEVRAVIGTHLEAIGLPTAIVDGAPRWTRDPATRKQIDYIVGLGGLPREPMTKGEASELIDDLLARRPATPRQIMLLRFFDRCDMTDRTKDEVSVWIDHLFANYEERERAWMRFKRETDHDPFETDASVVPVGAYRKYAIGRNKNSSASQTSQKPQQQTQLVIVLIVIALAASAAFIVAVARS